MINGIQNISFGGKYFPATKQVKDLPQKFVSEASDLVGSVNAKRAARAARDAEMYVDKDTFVARVASYKAANSPMPMPEEVAKEAKVEPNFNFFG